MEMVSLKFGKLKDANKSMPEGIQPPVSRVPAQALNYYTAVMPYAVVTIDLTNARSGTPVAIGNVTLPDGTVLTNWAANTLVVTSLPSTAVAQVGVGDSFTIPSAVGGCFTASAGMRIEAVPFTQIYVLNTAQSGVKLEAVLAWVDQT